MKKLFTNFLSGVLGGLLVLAIGIAALFYFNTFNYEIKIINPNSNSSITAQMNKMQLIRELEREGVLLTPQEYTSNVINYYNTVLTILAALLIIFSIVSYVHLKYISEEQLYKVFQNAMKKDKDFDKYVTDTIFGRAESKFAKTSMYDELIEKVNDLNNRLSSIEAMVEENEDKEDQSEVVNPEESED